MKNYKSLAALLLGFILTAALFPIQALAAGSIDLNRDASLTITEKYGETPLSGVRFDLYLVSTVDETGELTPEPALPAFTIFTFIALPPHLPAAGPGRRTAGLLLPPLRPGG